MASRRHSNSSNSISGTSVYSDAVYDPANAMDAQQQQQQQQPQLRRGGARFSRVLVEPSRAAAMLAHSPVKTDALTVTQLPTGTSAGVTSSSRNHPQSRSTPQPTRRSLLSRLFRMKTSRNTPRGYTDDYDDDGESRSEQLHMSAAASPSSHQSTPTHHQQHQHHQQRNPFCQDGNGNGTNDSEPSADPMSSSRVVVEGAMIKLSSHKYWHAKATYFVLEETTTASNVTTRVVLRQFKKRNDDEQLSEMELSECDVVVDISDRYIKYGLELLHRTPTTKQHRDHVEKSNEPSEELFSLRLSVETLNDHRKWIRALGSAIARLLDQSKRHYPVDFVRASSSGLDATDAVSAIVATSIPVRAAPAIATTVGTKGAKVAKVMPMISTDGLSEDEEDVYDDGEDDCGDDGCGGGSHANQVECEPAHEMRDPEEPEIHSDHEEEEDGGGGGRGGGEGGDARSSISSLSVISDTFSDAWHSPHHNNNSHDNGYASGDDDHNNNNNHQRSSNQFDDHSDNNDEDDEEAAAFARRLSESSQPDDETSAAMAFDASALLSTSFTRTHASPSGTSSAASTPSPRAAYKSAEAENDSASSSLADMVASMAETTIGTPPSTPPAPPVASSSSSSYYTEKPAYARQRQAALAASRLGPGALPAALQRPHVHSFNANGQVFTLDVRYKLLKSIGNGAYGAVISAHDTVTDTSVAVKKITNIFDDLVDAKRILREVRLLRHFHHKNITQLLDLAPPMTRKSFEDMYIITELMETDLHQVIYSMQPMSDDHVKYFLYQMLCALYHIHSSGVLHRDMKPSNILLNSNCDLKVCDFGLARGGMSAEKDATKLAPVTTELTEYVVTRWYRAPEIMLNCLQYTAAVDVWAVGCIFAEMLLREPLFPGNDYMHQLKLIIKFLGTPKQEDIAFVKNVKALRFLTKLSISKPKKWREVFTADDVNPLALDLLSQMLLFNPDKRISVENALRHPYLATFYDPADIARAPPFAFEFDLPDDKLTKDALVELLCEDVACFHPTLMHAMRTPPASASHHVPLPLFPRAPMMANGTTSGSTSGTNGPSSGNGSTGARYFGMTASAS